MNEISMQRLRISNFSCIRNADLETADLTILIGPQASGKSVISKLLYFFNDITSGLLIYAEEQLTQKEAAAAIGEQFGKWFPPSAWGAKPFHIRFEAASFEFNVKRSRSQKAPSERVQIKMSDAVWQHYDRLVASFSAAKKDVPPGEEDALPGSHTWEVAFRIRNTAERNLHKELGAAYVDYQLFVPAGRSFFTSIGKAVAAFDHGGLLDPITMKFGRYFTSVRERALRYRPYDTPSTSDGVRRNNLMVDLFGGEIKFERDKEYVETTDGRKIPFSVLSSGQQELLPLWLALSQFSNLRQPGTAKSKPMTTLIYIEEPEAHLFPTAQSLLLEHLASVAANERMGRNMLITTHSPYILSKINVLLKAGELGAQKRHQAKVAEIVPRSAWLKAKNARAYAIVDGQVVNILSEDGLIDGEYLDNVSGDIALAFNELLGIEFND